MSTLQIVFTAVAVIFVFIILLSSFKKDKGTFDQKLKTLVNLDFDKLPDDSFERIETGINSKGVTVRHYRKKLPIKKLHLFTDLYVHHHVGQNYKLITLHADGDFSDLSSQIETLTNRMYSLFGFDANGRGHFEDEDRINAGIVGGWWGRVYKDKNDRHIPFQFDWKRKEGVDLNIVIEGIDSTGFSDEQKALQLLDDDVFYQENQKEEARIAALESYDIEIAGIHIGQRYRWAEKCYYDDNRFYLKKEPRNKFDPNAIKIVSSINRLVGYVPSDDLDFVHSIFENIDFVQAYGLSDYENFKECSLEIYYATTHQ